RAPCCSSMSGIITSIRRPTLSTSTCPASGRRSTKTSTSLFCTLCAGPATRSAMDLASLTRRAISTSAFRAAAVAVAAYLVCAGLVVGLLLWQTNRILTDQVLATLGSEAELLRAEAQRGGDPALVRAVEARSLTGSPGLYFLADASGNKIAG